MKSRLNFAGHREGGATGTVSKALLIGVLLVANGFVGCASAPRRLTAPGADHLGEVLAHPQAPQVARDYPSFFDYVAQKIARLDHDLSLP
jgi:hypothetical protein